VRHSGVSILTAVIVAIVAYLVGFTHSWTRQAFSDWHARKNQMRTQRRLFFTGTWQLLQYGTAALLLAAFLILWVIRDERDGNRNTPLIPTKLRPAATCPATPPASKPATAGGCPQASATR
jgi:hypothetical protein